MKYDIQRDALDFFFDNAVRLFVAFAVVVTLYPFVYVVSVSMSSGSAVNRGAVYLWPVDIDFSTFKMVMGYGQLWTAYRNSVLYTALGTACNVAFTCLAAYPLSRRNFFLRKKLNFLIAFTMYFSGGLIPVYLVVTSLGLYNSPLAMIVPVLISAYNVMICRSAMEEIPEELFECAKMEGANDFLMLRKIAIPLVKPTLAVLTLYYAVARYNDFFSGLLYLGRTNLQTLQMFLRRILLLSSMEILQTRGAETAIGAVAQSTIQVRYVCIVLAAIPIVCVCPFVQKYLVKGTTLGAVKG